MKGERRGRQVSAVTSPQPSVRAAAGEAGSLVGVDRPTRKIQMHRPGALPTGKEVPLAGLIDNSICQPLCCAKSQLRGSPTQARCNSNTKRE